MCWYVPCFVCVRADYVAVVGVRLAESRLCWHGEPGSVISCQAETARQMDAVLFLDHVVVSVDGLLTVRLILSSSYLTVCYVSLKPVEIISM